MSIFAGVAVGLAVGPMATPVGWAAALVLSVAGSIAGAEVCKVAGTFAKNVYGDFARLENGRLLTETRK